MSDSSLAASAARPPRHIVVRALRVLGAWLAVEVAMLGLTVAWIAFHSHVIDPGHEVAHYEDYARRASPAVCLVISAPVFGLLGFLCGRRAGPAGTRFARTTTIVYAVLDGTVVAFVAGASADAWTVWTVAAALKFGAVHLGGRLGARGAGARS